MLLAIDVGNTNIVLGVYDGEEPKAYFRLSTSYERSRDEYGVMFLSFLQHKGISVEDIEAVIISSVVPQVMYSLERSVKKYIGKEPIVIDNKTDFGMKILYNNPAEVGADRIVNAYAAKKLYGTPLIIVDFGTATTFCAVSENGDYLGGAISPGIKISTEALFTRTAKLPRVEISKPDAVIGKNTVESMQSGILYGYVGQVIYIVNKMREEMKAPEARVIATGGLANLIAAETDIFFDINGSLTLEGLRLFYYENHAKL